MLLGLGKAQSSSNTVPSSKLQNVLQLIFRKNSGFVLANSCIPSVLSLANQN